MNAYKKFSYYYDEVMSNLEYELWHEFTLPYINKNSQILDLACGTGTFLTMLKLDGYENVEGLDLSETIIEIAREKAKINHLNIPFHVADMTNFKMDKKYDLITCYFDSVNFLQSKDDVNKMIRNVYNHLNSDGIFIFDCFSKFMMEEYKNNSYVTDSFVTFKLDWQTRKKNNMLIHDIKIIEDDTILREKYYEYYYDLKDFNLEGFNLLKICGDFNDDLEIEDERILYVLQKKRGA